MRANDLIESSRPELVAVGFQQQPPIQNLLQRMIRRQNFHCVTDIRMKKVATQIDARTMKCFDTSSRKHVFDAAKHSKLWACRRKRNFNYQKHQLLRIESLHLQYPFSKRSGYSDDNVREFHLYHQAIFPSFFFLLCKVIRCRFCCDVLPLREYLPIASIDFSTQTHSIIYLLPK